MNTECISSNTIDRYTDRYNKMGRHIKALGWGSEEQQRYRFEQALMPIDVKGKHLLDIGCGFGDLLTYCEKNNYKISHYTGWDLNPKFIEEASKSSWCLNSDFDEVDLLHDKDNKVNFFNIAIMLGLLNFRLQNEKENYEYSKKMIHKAFELVDEVLVVDFLSTVFDTSYPKEDFVFYHDPVKMLEFALQLSPKVVFKQDYSPIPQREFMLFIYK